MKETIVLTREAGQGYAFSISFPYQEDLVDAFHQLVPESGRSWRKPTWLFRRAYLDALRLFAEDACGKYGWRLIDMTREGKAQATLLRAEVEQVEYEEHVAGVLDILPRLPAKSLKLAGWFSDALVMDLEVFLESRDLFLMFVRSGLPNRKQPAVGYISLRAHTTRLLWSNEPHIVAALLEQKILSLEMLDLAPQVIYDSGIAHFRDHQGAFWFGAPYSEALEKEMRFYRPGDCYRVSLVGHQIYLLVAAESYFHKHLGERKPLVPFLQFYSLEEWFSEWVVQKLQSEICTAASTLHKWLWLYPTYWGHPADALLSHLGGDGDPDLQAFLKISDTELAEHMQRIERLKREHAHAYLLACQERCLELVLPVLHGKRKEELRKLADQEQIVTRVSWTQTRLIQALVSAGEASERIAFQLLELPPRETIQV